MDLRPDKEISKQAEALWTVPETARFLRLSEDTVRKKARNKELPGIKIGKTWRFRQSEIVEWLNRNSNEN